MMQNSHTSRKGVTMLEVSVAAMITIAATLVAVQFISLANIQRRCMWRTSIALDEIANTAERVSQLSWEELNEFSSSDSQWQPSSLAQENLDDAKLQVSVSSVADDPTARKIFLQLTWNERTGQREQSLTTWRHER